MAPGLLAVVILSGAFAVIAFLAPQAGLDQAEFTPTAGIGGPAAGEFGADWPESEWPALADSLVTLNHLVDLTAIGGGETPEPSDETPDEEPAPDSGPEVVELGNFKFLGVLTTPEDMTALITINRKQRFVKAGDTVGDYEIVEVATDGLTIRNRQGVEQLLTRAPRGEESLNTVERFNRQRSRAEQLQQQDAEGRRRNDSPRPDRPDR